MKILALNCTQFGYVADRPAFDPPEGIEIPKPAVFADCLLVLISVEPGDEQRVTAACKALRRLARRLDAHTLVINGFAHLSEQLEDPDVSQDVLGEVAERMRDTITNVAVTPFGWHKRFEMSVRSDDSSQKFIHV